NIKKAQDYEPCFGRVRELVKPIRDGVDRDRYRNLWWLHAENRPGLYHSIGSGAFFERHPKNWNPSISLKHVIAKAKTSETWAFALLPSAMIFDQAITVIASDSMSDFAVVQSGLHEVWARESGAGSTMKTDMRYA